MRLPRACPVQVQSHEELISELIRQLKESKEEKASLEREFIAYRKQTQVGRGQCSACNQCVTTSLLSTAADMYSCSG